MSNEFNPAKFIDKGWKFGKKPNDRIETPKEFDSNKVKLISVLKPGETSVKGEERRNRLIALPEKKLGTNNFFWLWQDKSRIPEEWKKRDENGNVIYITFDADVLVNLYGDRCVLYLMALRLPQCSGCVRCSRTLDLRF